jgi:hypothetical protein
MNPASPAPTSARVPFVAVVGLHSSGSSCLAGVLYHLGLHLGNKLGGYYGANPEESCGFEAAGLFQLCQAAIPFPTVHYAQPRDQIRANLSDWVMSRQREALARGTIAGGKYPNFCRLGDELMTICGDGLLVVHCNRPLEESIVSLVRRSGHRYSPDALAAHQRWLWEGKQEFLSKVAHLTVEYDELLKAPDVQVSKLVDFLGIRPDDDQVARALSYVKPEQRHVRSRQVSG